MQNPVKVKLQQGEPVYGLLSPLADTAVTEMLALSGFDYVMFDLEHGPMSYRDLEEQARAARGAGAVPLARVPDNDPRAILRALDAGVLGVMVPQVESAEEAARAARACRYAPEGIRGAAGVTSAGRWGTVPLPEHMAASNAAVLCIVQVESRRALDHLPEITGTPGVDAVLVGPADLSQSLGYPGRPDHPEVQAAIARVFAHCRQQGMPFGLFTGSPAEVPGLREQGATLFMGSSVLLIQRAAAAWNQTMRGKREPQQENTRS